MEDSFSNHVNKTTNDQLYQNQASNSPVKVENRHTKLKELLENAQNWGSLPGSL